MIAFTAAPFLESRFALPSVTVFLHPHDLRWCVFSKAELCVAECRSLHSSVLKLQHWFIPHQSGDLRPPGNFWWGPKRPCSRGSCAGGAEGPLREIPIIFSLGLSQPGSLRDALERPQLHQPLSNTSVVCAAATRGAGAV